MFGPDYPSVPPAWQAPHVPGAIGPTADAMTTMFYENNKKSAVIAYILWFFVGWLGGHRFYLKRTGSGFAMLMISLASLPLIVVLVGFVGLIVVWVWHLVDAFLIPDMTTDYNNRLIRAMAPQPA